MFKLTAPYILSFNCPQKASTLQPCGCLSMILNDKEAEGFDFQTLQTLQQPFSVTFPDFG